MSRGKEQLEELNKETELDKTLRPKDWNDYVGQEKIKENLKIIIKAAKQRSEPPTHLLFYGGAGLGKTTLAHIIANKIGQDIRTVAGPAIQKTGDLAAILTNLEQGSVLFIDEVHRINKSIEEYLYSAMEDFKLNMVLGRGAMAKTMEMEIPKFTLIGATTRLASLSNPLRSRFGATFGLNFYTLDDIKKILKRSSKILNVKAENEALEMIAKSSRFTPRTTNHLLKRVRDYAQVKAQGKITKEVTKKSLKSLDIDEKGLTLNDRKILKTIIEKFDGGPVGLQALAAATHEEKNTILDIYEPYLLQIGFIERTPRGRVATQEACKHLELKDNQVTLL